MNCLIVGKTKILELTDNEFSIDKLSMLFPRFEQIQNQDCLLRAFMSLLINILSLISAFLAMEFVAWISHKYLMHGFGWSVHKDHHQPQQGAFQKNDLFFLLFAIPAITFIFYGIHNGTDWMVFLGIGISAYGMCYFLIHDVFIHQRFSWFKRSDNVYLRAIRKAHKVHHKSQVKEGGECFGMLLVPIRYFREASAKQ